MRLLLDTHCWLWLQTAPDRLGPDLLALLGEPANDHHLSAASAWEIAIKFGIGKLPLPDPPHVYVPSRMAACGSVGLAVVHSHALHVAELPAHHRDPFDRMLIAQARLERLTLVTADRQLEPYDVELRFVD